MGQLAGIAPALWLVALLALARPIAAVPLVPPAPPYFRVSCILEWANKTFGGISGSKYCCYFRNPSRTLPINNYQFETANFKPLLWVTGARADITPRGYVDAYVPPSQSKQFCFVNTASVGRPSLAASRPPFPVATLSFASTPGIGALNLSCSVSPTYEQAGRTVLAKFTCTLRNLLPFNVSGAKFSCNNSYFGGALRIIRTDNFNPDCTWQGSLAPSSSRTGSSTNFSFWVIPPANVTISLVAILPPSLPPPQPPTPPSSPSPPPPLPECVYEVTELGYQGRFNNGDDGCIPVNGALCPFGQRIPVDREGDNADDLRGAVVFRLPAVDTQRCLLVDTVSGDGLGFDTVVFLRTPWSEPRTWLLCNDDADSDPLGHGSNLFFWQEPNVLYEIFVSGHFSFDVGTFPVFITLAEDPSDCNPSSPPPPPPRPETTCVYQVTELGYQGMFSNAGDGCITYGAYCNPSIGQRIPAYTDIDYPWSPFDDPLPAVVLRLPAVDTQRCLLVSTVSSEGTSFDTVVFLRTPWSGPRTWLRCNDDLDDYPYAGSNLFVKQEPSVLYEIFISGHYSWPVGTFPVFITLAEDASNCNY